MYLPLSQFCDCWYHDCHDCSWPWYFIYHVEIEFVFVDSVLSIDMLIAVLHPSKENRNSNGMKRI